MLDIKPRGISNCLVSHNLFLRDKINCFPFLLLIFHLFVYFFYVESFRLVVVSFSENLTY